MFEMSDEQFNPMVDHLRRFDAYAAQAWPG